MMVEDWSLPLPHMLEDHWGPTLTGQAAEEVGESGGGQNRGGQKGVMREQRKGELALGMGQLQWQWLLVHMALCQ